MVGQNQATAVSAAADRAQHAWRVWRAAEAALKKATDVLERAEERRALRDAPQKVINAYYAADDAKNAAWRDVCSAMDAFVVLAPDAERQTTQPPYRGSLVNTS